MKTFNATVKLNPAGLIAIAVIALAAGILLPVRRTSEYVDKAKALAGITAEANKSVHREKTEPEAKRQDNLAETAKPEEKK